MTLYTTNYPVKDFEDGQWSSWWGGVKCSWHGHHDDLIVGEMPLYDASYLLECQRCGRRTWNYYHDHEYLFMVENKS
jgi:hypothetical protein